MSSESERFGVLEGELAAAQKTVVVLKEKVHAMQSGSRSTIQRQLDASKRREDEGRRRRELAEVRATELAKHSARLEAEVARRTMAMRRILNNVTFGFLVADRKLVVQPEATDSCVRLFGAERVEGESLVKLLRLDARAKASFEVAVDQVFEDILDERAALSLIATDYRIDERTIRAEASVVRDAAGAIEGLLFTVSDVSALLAAQRESAENKLLVSILRNRETFESFVDDVRSLLAYAAKAFEENDMVTARRMVHTIKGNAASYDLIDLVEVTHRVEDQGITAEGIRSIRQALVDFLKRHYAVLGISLEDARTASIEIPLEKVVNLKRVASKIQSPELRVVVAEVCERPATVLLGPIQTFAARLGERLGKRVELAVVGGETLLDDERMRPVFQTLPHLVRNAVDHGIEAPEERGEKPATGQVTVTICGAGDAYTVRVSDDGGGLDLDRLGARALALGVVNAAQLAAMSEVERCHLVFHDGVSTAEALTDISGRGVGMSAVLAAVRAAGGHVVVESRPGAGTTFTLCIPKPKTERTLSLRPSQLRPSHPPS